MLPNPLHPAIVHFPVVLAFLLPVAAAGAVWAIRRGAKARAAWVVPVFVAGTLTLSSWAAVETGEQQEEKVERVVSERQIGEHAEMAEAFLAASSVVAIIAAIGFAGGAAGRVARIATVMGAIVLVGVAAKVGHSGGQLVYRYGAANAYLNNNAAGDVSIRAGAPSFPKP